MLEELTNEFLSLDPVTIHIATYGTAGIGALVAALLSKSEARLARVPYFALWGLCALMVGLSTLPSIYFPVAYLNGLLWVLLAYTLLVNGFAGYALCWISMARSRDAWGSASRAILAFVPAANLWLFLSPTADPSRETKQAPGFLFTGATGLCVGLGAIVAGAVAGHAGNFATRTIIKALPLDPVWSARGELKQVRERGLDAVVDSLIKSTEMPLRIDDFTNLVELYRDGMVLIQKYIITTPNSDSILILPPYIVDQVVSYTCRSPRTRALIESGMTIQHTYSTKDDRKIGVVRVGPEKCADSFL